MQSGYIAAGTFLLFTGGGACAQLLKLWKRQKAWRRGELTRSQICEGLHPVREWWSFFAFTLFALSGLTRSYTDYFLLCSRLPVIVLSTAVIWFLRAHGAPRAALLFNAAICSNLILVGMIAAMFLGLETSAAHVAHSVDLGVSVVGVLMCYGKIAQARTMYRDNRSRGVSWLRELGVVIKDLSGLWYAITVGPELLLVGITHAMSSLSSGSICAVKYTLESRASRKSVEPAGEGAVLPP